jgi:hypothetical protein
MWSSGVVSCMLTEVSRNIGISRRGMESWNGATALLPSKQPRHFKPQTALLVDGDFWVWVAKTLMATRFTSRGGDALNCHFSSTKHSFYRPPQTLVPPLGLWNKRISRQICLTHYIYNFPLGLCEPILVSLSTTTRHNTPLKNLQDIPLNNSGPIPIQEWYWDHIIK